MSDKIEQHSDFPVDSEAWLQEWAREKFTYAGSYRPRVLGQLYGNTDWALARALHSAIVAAVMPAAAQSAPAAPVAVQEPARELIGYACDRRGALMPDRCGEFRPGGGAGLPRARRRQPDIVAVPRELLAEAESIIESYAEALKASRAPGGDWEGEEAAQDDYEREAGVASKLRALLRGGAE